MSNNYLKTKKFRDFDLRKSDGTYEIQTGELHENTDVAQDVFLVGYRVGENDVNGSNSREFKIKLESLEPQTKWDDLQFHIVKTTNEEESTIYTLYYNTVGETTFQSEYEDENPWKVVSDFIEIPKSDAGSNFDVAKYRTDFYQPTENFNVELFDPNEGIEEEELIPYTDSFEERNTDLLALVTMLDENDNAVGYFWYYIPYTKPIGNYISDITFTPNEDNLGGGVITYTTTNYITDESETIVIPGNQTLSYSEGVLHISDGNYIYIPAGNGEPGVGIASIVKTDTDGLEDTYTITYTDGNTFNYTITNGRDGVDGADSTVPGPQGPQGEQGIQGPAGVDGSDGRGISAFSGPVIVNNNKTYTFTYTDGTNSTFTVADGLNGRGVSTIGKTGANGLSDTYTITYSDGTTSTFSVTNGANGSSITVVGSFIDTSTDETVIQFSDNTIIRIANGHDGADGTDGVGVDSVELHNGASFDPTSGANNTYDVIGTNGLVLGTFDIRNGITVLPTMTESISGGTHTLTFSGLGVGSDSQIVITDGTNGTNGTNGIDGTTFELYRVTISAQGYTNPNTDWDLIKANTAVTGDSSDGTPTYYNFDCYDRNSTLIYTVEKFNASAMDYEDYSVGGSNVYTQQTFDTLVTGLMSTSSGVVDICPDSENASSVATSLLYGMYGEQNVAGPLPPVEDISTPTTWEWRFHTVRPITGDDKIKRAVFTVKVYSNIQ